MVLVLGKAAAQLWLNRLNQRHVRQNAGDIPEAFRGMISVESYHKSVAYTLARSRLDQVQIGWDTLVLLGVLFSGILPWAESTFRQHYGNSLPAAAAFLFLVGAALSFTGWPLDWYAQFRIEQRFGFNNTTPTLWWTDRLKGLGLGLLLGYPLLLLILIVVWWAGDLWWLWTWGTVLAFETLLLVLAPVLLMPLFNKFTPLPEGSLRTRLAELAQRTGFRARRIEVMDGSKRSKHSNAFFTGFGRFRKIVLFDTLLEQLEETELAAVLAHEIGHYKKGHIPKMLIVSALSLLGACYVLALLAQAEWFYAAFGFAPGSIVVAFLLFGLLAGTVTFWVTPLASLWSRRFEYQADAFAATAMGEAGSLIGALRKLNEKNLSNLTPHPLYSGFYYSHPALLEREQALARSVADVRQVGAPAQ